MVKTMPGELLPWPCMMDHNLQRLSLNFYTNLLFNIGELKTVISWVQLIVKNATFHMNAILFRRQEPVPFGRTPGDGHHEHDTDP